METQPTYRICREVVFKAPNGIDFDAGELRNILEQHVNRHPAHEGYVSTYGAGGNDAPPSADVFLQDGELTIRWTSEDEQRYATAYTAERERRDAEKQTPAVVPDATEGAA